MLTVRAAATADPVAAPRVRPMSADSIAATAEVDDVVPAGEAVGGDTVDPPMIDDELLVEEISIDGMCGVY